MWGWGGDACPFSPHSPPSVAHCAWASAKPDSPEKRKLKKKKGGKKRGGRYKRNIKSRDVFVNVALARAKQMCKICVFNWRGEKRARREKNGKEKWNRSTSFPSVTEKDHHTSISHITDVRCKNAGTLSSTQRSLSTSIDVGLVPTDSLCVLVFIISSSIHPFYNTGHCVNRLLLLLCVTPQGLPKPAKKHK